MIDSTLRRRLVVIALPIIVAACQSSTGPRAHPATHPAGHNLVSLALPGRPHGVAIAPSGKFCISQIDGNSVTCGLLGTPPAAPTLDSISVSVGAAPAHIALDPGGDRAYTANQGDATMSVVDISTHTVVGSVPLSDAGYNILASPNGARVYVTTESGTLHIVDAGSLQVIATLQVGSGANGLAYDAATHTLYVSSIFDGTITAISTDATAITRTYQVGGGPQRIALSADGSELYVASQEYGLQVLALADGSVTTVSGIRPGSVGLALSPDDGQLYVTNPPDGIVYIVDRAARQVLDSLPYFRRPRNVSFDQTGSTAIITDETGYVHFVR